MYARISRTLARTVLSKATHVRSMSTLARRSAPARNISAVRINYPAKLTAATLSKKIFSPSARVFLSSSTSESKSQWQPRAATTDLDSVGGNPELLNSLADIVRYLQNPSAYIKRGIKPPKGVILGGPPGVGKTFIAEAIAGHAGVSLLMISGSDFVKQYIGQSEEAVRGLFEKAKQIAPCVLCIDEIDSIANKRIDSPRQGSELYYNSVVNQLLPLLSQDHPGVVVVATTNNPKNIDEAIKRDGRFDRTIFINLPNFEDRLAILKKHLAKKEIDASVSLEDLAKISTGFSGAKIANWVNEAALCALHEEANSLSARHFERARSNLRGSVQRIQTDLVQRRRTALHESAHAVVAHFEGQRVYKVSALIVGEDLGRTEILPSSETKNYTKQEALNRICVSLAGRAGEQLAQTVQFGAYQDIQDAIEIANEMLKEGMGSTLSNIKFLKEAEEILQQQMTRATEILIKHESEWKSVADALFIHHELNREEFLKVLEGKTLDTKPLSSLVTTVSRLPPKKTMNSFSSKSEASFSKVNENEKENEQDKPLPFTMEEVAKALNLEPDMIRKIKREMFGGYEILIKPSFSNHVEMEEMSKTLNKNDVENLYFKNYLHNPQFTIRKEGAEDFVKYVKKINSSNALANQSAENKKNNKPIFSKWFGSKDEEKQFSVTIEEIARALTVDRCEIINLTKPGLGIIFKRGFSDHQKIEKIFASLNKDLNLIVSSYLRELPSPELYIPEENLEKFVKFVKKVNEEKENNNKNRKPN